MFGGAVCWELPVVLKRGLRNRLFAHIQTLSASYFDRTRTGDLMAHATNDIKQVRMATGMGMVALNDAIVLGGRCHRVYALYQCDP